MLSLVYYRALCSGNSVSILSTQHSHVALAGVMLVGFVAQATAQEPPVADGPATQPIAEGADSPVDDEPEMPEPKKLPPPTSGKKLSPDYDIWVDKERGIVMIDGQVTLRNGPLEMFACTKGTKEHESIVACNTKAFLAHAGLLNVGAETGTPVRYDESYHPPTGTEIEIEVYWLDKDGNRKKAKAQDWVRDARTEKPMTLPWVFAGSGFWQDETTGDRVYLAEQGDFICVSNFSSAMLDVPAESTQTNDGLFFEAFEERIPPLGTWVRLVLRPKTEEAKTGDTQTETAQPEN